MPGTPLDWRPWLWGSLAATVAVALVVIGLAALLPGGADDDGDPGVAGEQPTAPPTASTSTGPAASTTPAAPAPFQCWDGAAAQTLKDCSRPAGVEGLRWIFPAMAGEKCGKPDTSGEKGLELRVLCLHRLADGTRIGVGYFQWASVQAGVDFYDGQGLEASNVPGPDGKPVHFGFFGLEGDNIKAASLYTEEPFSLTITYPAATSLSEQDQLSLAPRPPEQVRGAPVS